MGIKVFYHIFTNDGEVLNLVRDSLEKIIFSGLYDKADSINCFVVGRRPKKGLFLQEKASRKLFRAIIPYLLSFGERIRILDSSPDDLSAERFTLLRIPQLVSEEDSVLYLHTKGCTKVHTDKYPRIRDWINMMQFFLIKGHQRCLDLLATHEVVGVNLHPADELHPVHFSGNFWWASGRYLRRLGADDMDSGYYGPEMFLFKKNPTHMCLFESGIDHYQKSFPYSKFIDSPS